MLKYVILSIILLYYGWYYIKQPYVKAKTIRVFILQFIPFFWVVAGMIERLRGLIKKFKTLYRRKKQSKYNGGIND
jgi:hypothetical protein